MTPEDLANLAHPRRARDLTDRDYARPLDDADDFVVLRSSAAQAEQAQQHARVLLGNLGLALHPDKTLVVDLREGKEGFDFLGCHLRAGMSGRLWEQKPIIRYDLHGWPSQRLMKRARLRIKALTSRSRVGMQLEDVIGALNLFLRGWGGYFRTGNAADKFVELDRHVAWRLKRLLIQQRGRNLRAGQASRWTPTWFHDQGRHQLTGTLRYPKTELTPGSIQAVIFRAEDLDATFEKVRASGAEVLREPVSQQWGARDRAFRDPSGNLVRIAEA
jgi:RNA-directed DNA polymerase